jgi:flagellar hook-associated protein 2
MANITVGGIATGLPSDLVDKLVQAEQAPLNRLADKKVAQQTRLQAVQDLNSALLTMQTAMEGLDAPESFQVHTAASSDTGFVAVSADTTAATGTYTVTDVVLAGADQKRHTAGVASRTDPLASGTFAFTYAGGTEQQVVISGGETLDDLVTKINDLNAGVTAHIVNDGSSDYLVLSGNDTGAANTIDITSNTTITGFEAVDFTDTGTERDASFKLDGLTVTGTDNTFTGTVEGLTIDLKQATAGESVTLTVAQDGGAVQDKVQAFVDAYNQVASLLQAHTQYDTDNGQHSVLFGDATVRSLQFQLRKIISTPVEGLSGTYTTLAELGVTTDSKTGTLSLSTSKLQTAIDTDFTGVGKLFYSDSSGGTEGYAAQMATYLDAMTNAADGLMKGKTSAIEDRITALDDQIASTQRAVDLASERIRKQFANLETLVSDLQSKTSGPLQALLNLTGSSSSSSSGSTSGG